MSRTIIQEYQQRVAATSAEISILNKKANTVSLLRLFVILGGAALVFQCVRTEIIWLTFLSAIGVLLLFMWLVARQSKLEQQKKAAEDFRWVNQNELDIAGGAANGYPNGIAFADNRHTYSADLDVYGEASLFASINRCATPAGNKHLADWLGVPADAKSITARQEAIKELAADLEWAQQVQAGLLFNLKEPVDYQQRFTVYLSNPLFNLGGKFLRMYVRFAPWALLAAIILSFFIKTFSGVATVIALANLFLTILYAGRVTRVSAGIDRTSKVLASFAGVFRRIENFNWQSPLNKRIAGKLFFGQQQPVSAAIADLSTIISRLDYRLNMLVGGLLNIFLLWDFRQVFDILDWRRKYQQHVLEAFESISQLEVLISLASLHRNHPQWAFPVIITEKRTLEATALKHPLIPDQHSVANDYCMENHQIALITGSNMAGKSTFLRTVGSNMVLAFAGAPVCATHMRVSVVKLVTYMRIRDSLNESTSTFKAELNRMQLILQLVEKDSQAFFLLDEMLRGTNSVDKYLGSKAVIKKLITDKGVGMVATHDLQLAKLADEYPGVVQNFHFDIQILNEEMLFDYKLKDGECKIFNASMLLKQIGIHIE